MQIVSLKNVNAGLCLDTDGGQLSLYASGVIGICTASSSQHWTLLGDAPAPKTIKQAGSGLCAAINWAANGGVANPMGSAVKNYYALAEAAGRGGAYVPALADFVAELNGISE